MEWGFVHTFVIGFIGEFFKYILERSRIELNHQHPEKKIKNAPHGARTLVLQGLSVDRNGPSERKGMIFLHKKTHVLTVERKHCQAYYGQDKWCKIEARYLVW